jgi:hypothetical protein
MHRHGRLDVYPDTPFSQSAHVQPGQGILSRADNLTPQKIAHDHAQHGHFFQSHTNIAVSP